MNYSNNHITTFQIHFYFINFLRIIIKSSLDQFLQQFVLRCGMISTAISSTLSISHVETFIFFPFSYKVALDMFYNIQFACLLATTCTYLLPILHLHVENIQNTFFLKKELSTSRTQSYIVETKLFITM